MNILDLSVEDLALHINWGVVEPSQVKWSLYLQTTPLDAYNLKIWEHERLKDIVSLISHNKKQAVIDAIKDDFNNWLEDYAETILPPTIAKGRWETEKIKVADRVYNDWCSEFDKYLSNSTEPSTADEEQPFDDKFYLEEMERLEMENPKMFEPMTESQIQAMVSPDVDIDQLTPPDNPDEEKPTPSLPKEVFEIIDEAVIKGLCYPNTDHSKSTYNWNKTIQLCAYFCERISLYLELSDRWLWDKEEYTAKWKPFVSVFGYSEDQMKSAKQSYKKNKNHKPKGFEEIDNLIKQA